MYGTNSVTSGLLLLFILVIGNVIAQVKLPAALDTSRGGLHSLAKPTREFIEGLEQPVNAYLIMPEAEGNPIYDGARRLLRACQEAGGDKFRVNYLVPGFDNDEILELTRKHAGLQDSNSSGLLLTVGEDEQTSAFISYSRACRTPTVPACC